MHYAYYKNKLLLTYYLNISVQAGNLSDCRIESNRNFFSPNWNALLVAQSRDCRTRVRLTVLTATRLTHTTSMYVNALQTHSPQHRCVVPGNCSHL